MKAPDARRAAQNSVRDQLREAARRETLRAGPAPRRRKRRNRRRWRGAGLLVAALLGASVAAGATDLISVGAPLPDPSLTLPRFAPRDGGVGALVVKAPDPDAGVGWGVAIYTSADGQDCAIAGQVRGVTLGQVRDGRFRPYAKNTTGACGRLGRRMPIFIDIMRIAGSQPRTIIYGRTRPSERFVSINDHGRRRTVGTGPGGAYIFVVRGVFSQDDGLRDLDIRPGSRP